MTESFDVFLTYTLSLIVGGIFCQSLSLLIGFIFVQRQERVLRTHGILGVILSFSLTTLHIGNNIFHNNEIEFILWYGAFF